jgi:hypothetical protein
MQDTPHKAERFTATIRAKVPPSLQRRLLVIAAARTKDLPEISREAFTEYAARMERKLGLNGGGK